MQKSRFMNTSVMVLTALLGALAIAREAAPADEQGHTASKAAASAEDIAPLGVGSEMPSAHLQTLEGETIDLREMVTEQPAVLVFYRGGWCPYCTAHLAELAKQHDELKAMGFQVIGISPDTHEAAAVTVKEKDLPYTLLADPEMKAAQNFGLAFELSSFTAAKYRIAGIPLGEKDSARRNQLPVPAVYLVENGGNIAFAHYDPGYKTRLDGEKLMEAAEKIVNPDAATTVSQAAE